MPKLIGWTALLFAVLLFRAADAQETCSPIQPDGKPCIETTLNEETQPGVWKWSFHNACASPLAMEFRRGNGSKSGEFDIRANSDSPWYCSDNCGGVVHHSARCYGGQAHETTSTPRPLAAAAPKASATPEPRGSQQPSASAPVEPKPAPTRKFSELACAESGKSCHDACLQSFGSKGASNADGQLACNQSCTAQLGGCMETGDALVNSGTAISAGNAVPGKAATKEKPSETRLKTSRGAGSKSSGGADQSAGRGGARKNIGGCHWPSCMGHCPPEYFRQLIVRARPPCMFAPG